MWSERKHGLSTEKVPVSADAGSSKNLEGPKGPDTNTHGCEGLGKARLVELINTTVASRVQGYLAHKKSPTPLDRHRSLGMVLL